MWGAPLLSGMTGSSPMVYPLSLLVQVVSLTFGVGVGHLSCTPTYPPSVQSGAFPSTQGWGTPPMGTSHPTRRLKCRYQSRITGHDPLFKPYGVYRLQPMHPSEHRHILQEGTSPRPHPPHFLVECLRLSSHWWTVGTMGVVDYKNWCIPHSAQHSILKTVLNILKFLQERLTIHSSQALYYVTDSPYLKLSVLTEVLTNERLC